MLLLVRSRRTCILPASSLRNGISSAYFKWSNLLSTRTSIPQFSHGDWAITTCISNKKLRRKSETGQPWQTPSLVENSREKSLKGRIWLRSSAYNDRKREVNFSGTSTSERQRRRVLRLTETNDALGKKENWAHKYTEGGPFLIPVVQGCSQCSLRPSRTCFVGTR